MDRSLDDHSLWFQKAVLRAGSSCSVTFMVDFRIECIVCVTGPRYRFWLRKAAPRTPTPSRTQLGRCSWSSGAHASVSGQLGLGRRLWASSRPGGSTGCRLVWHGLGRDGWAAWPGIPLRASVALLTEVTCFLYSFDSAFDSS